MLGIPPSHIKSNIQILLAYHEGMKKKQCVEIIMNFSLLQVLIYFAANLLQGTLSLSPNSTSLNPGPGDCFKGGDHNICLPKNYSKYDLPSFKESVLVTIEVHIKDIPKVVILIKYY